MNILIFGATGGTGRQIVAQALERRHSVTAFVRDAARLQVAHPLLRCVVGDAMDLGSVGTALQDQDAVLGALGTMPEAKERQEMSVRDSALDWTIIRPVRLSDAARSDHVRSGKNLAWGLTSAVSRRDVAAVMLDALHDAGTLKSAITVLS